MIQLNFKKLRVEASDAPLRSDLLLRIVADFMIQIDGSTLYAEVDFPVVELASQLAQWVRTGADQRPDFEYDSMESDAAGLVWIRREGKDWRIGSIHQEHDEKRRWSSEQVDAAIRLLMGELVKSAEADLGRDIRPFVEFLQV